MTARRLIAALLVTMLAGIPCAQAVAVTLDTCPSSCPMHQRPMGCHEAPGAKTTKRCCERPPGLRNAGCRHADRDVSALPPAVLPMVPSIVAMTFPWRDRALAPPIDGRLPEAPDTPPPIVVV